MICLQNQTQVQRHLQHPAALPIISALREGREEATPRRLYLVMGRGYSEQNVMQALAALPCPLTTAPGSLEKIPHLGRVAA